jgi:tetratricopeptide (TPR) repeat protein
LFALGRSRLLRGESHGADSLRKVIASHPAGTLAMDARILLLMAGHLPPARTAGVPSEVSDTKRAELEVLDRGERLLVSGSPDEALACFDAVRSSLAPDAASLAAIGLCHLKSGDRISAMASFAEALREFPDSGVLRELAEDASTGSPIPVASSGSPSERQKAHHDTAPDELEALRGSLADAPLDAGRAGEIAILLAKQGKSLESRAMGLRADGLRALNAETARN